MKFKYTICLPNKSEIQYFDEILNGDQVLENAKRYPWISQLELTEKLGVENVHYSPSLEFINTNTNHSFTLTAIYNDRKELSFSLWYNRPKKVKVLFGILGEKEKMVVDDVWDYNLTDAIRYLEYFVNDDIKEIEKIYK